MTSKVDIKKILSKEYEYEINSFNEIFAENLIKLRKLNKMSQLDLAEKINYSDKAVSKWERGNAMPDVTTLCQIANLFHVSMDYLLIRHTEEEYTQTTPNYAKLQRKNRIMIMAVSIAGIVTAALVLYFILYYISGANSKPWMVFIYMIPVCAILTTVLTAIWKQKIMLFLSITILMWGLLFSVILSLPNPVWFALFVGLPLQIVILFSFGIIRLKK